MEIKKEVEGGIKSGLFNTHEILELHVFVFQNLKSLVLHHYLINFR